MIYGLYVSQLIEHTHWLLHLILINLQPTCLVINFLKPEVIGLKPLGRTSLTVQLRGVPLLLDISISLIAKNTRGPADHKIGERPSINFFGDYNTKFLQKWNNGKFIQILILVF